MSLLDIWDSIVNFDIVGGFDLVNLFLQENLIGILLYFGLVVLLCASIAILTRLFDVVVCYFYDKIKSSILCIYNKKTSNPQKK